jgi:sec-independent protein translocase protein TatA
MQPFFGFLPTLGGTELIILLVAGILLFGRKLPDIGRSLGKTVTEFKKGVKGLEDEVETTSASRSVEPEPLRPPQRLTSAAPKFEDVPSASQAVAVPPKV